MTTVTGISHLRNLGVFKDNDEEHTFGPLTLLFGLNGTGKSTLAACARALRTDNALPLVARKRRGADNQNLTFHFSDGSNVSIVDGIAQANVPTVHVYDELFVENNVFSKHSISPEHRRSLTQLVLGAETIQAELDRTTAEAAFNASNQESKIATAELKALVPDGITLGQFIRLTPADSQGSVEELERLIATHANIQQLRTATPPTVPPTPQKFDLEFGRSIPNLENTHAEALKAVAEQAQRHKVDPEWIQTGFLADPDATECPYCAQPLNDSPTIGSYRQAFDDAFNLALAKAKGDLRSAKDSLSSLAAENCILRLTTFNTNLKRWTEHVQIDELAVPELADLQASFEKLSGILDIAWSTPDTNPESTQGITREWDSEWLQVQQLLAKSETQAAAAVSAIVSFQSSVADESDLAEQRERLLRLKAAQVRHSTAGTRAVDKYVAKTALAKKDSSARNTARTDFATAIAKISKTFLAKLNSTLDRLHAGFTVVDLSSDFLGGSPRSTFGIKTAGTTFTASDTADAFSTALSDGDKRALGLAFFLCSVASRDETSTEPKILFIDDPFTSLDRDRTLATVEFIVELAGFHQVIVSSHDPHFLHDVQQRALKIQRQPQRIATELQIIKSGSPASSKIVSADLAEICATQYFRNYRLVQAVAEGSSTDFNGAFAAARPLLEEYLRLKFSHEFSVSQSMLDGMISRIASSKKPLADFDGIRQHVPTLDRIRVFTNPPHHAGQGSVATIPPTSQEVSAYCTLVLHFIQGRLAL